MGVVDGLFVAKSSNILACDWKSILFGSVGSHSDSSRCRDIGLRSLMAKEVMSDHRPALETSKGRIPVGVSYESPLCCDGAVLCRAADHRQRLLIGGIVIWGWGEGAQWGT
jgi:hypothetical protein